MACHGNLSSSPDPTALDSQGAGAGAVAAQALPRWLSPFHLPAMQRLVRPAPAASPAASPAAGHPPPRRELSKGRRRLVNRLKVALVNILPVLLIWKLCFFYISSTFELMVANADRETLRLARVVEENMRHTVGEVERTIGHIREMHAFFGDQGSWPTILEKLVASNPMVLQVAVVGWDGYLISSSAQLNPPVKLYLGDRDHIRAHLDDPTDKLFISTPVMGRVSGKWAIQFTRPFYDKDWRVGGVIVVSLNVDYLAVTYRNTEMGERSGIALLSRENVILAGRGTYASQFGQVVPPDVLASAGVDRPASAATVLSVLGDEPFVIRVARDLGTVPLRVLFENRSAASYVMWLSNARIIIAASAGLSTVSLLLTTLLVRRRIAYERTLSRLAYYDALTGLANRQQFFRVLSKLCRAMPDSGELAVIMIALDQIKTVHDRYGQHVGDAVLRQASDRLASQFDVPDAITARMSDDEFAVAFRVGPEDTLAAVCERILSALRVPFYSDRHLIRLTSSVGAVRMRVGEETEARLVHAAGFALREARRRGGDRYQLFDSALNAKVERDLQIEVDLAVALEDKKLDVYYQPVVRAVGHAVVGYESLVRWKREDGTFISPAEFVPVAEARGLIGQLDRFVIERVFSLAHRLIEHPEMAVSVNISASELHNGDILDFLKQCSARYAVSPRNIRIEITETAIMQDIEIAVAGLSNMLDSGFSILLDDFGTGYSSLSYLLRFPVSGIKIDRSFVRRLSDDPRDRVIVSAIVHIARELDLRVVAEGVETEAEAAILTEMGVDYLQGYMFGRPAPVDVLRPVLMPAGPEPGPLAELEADLPGSSDAHPLAGAGRDGVAAPPGPAGGAQRG